MQLYEVIVLGAQYRLGVFGFLALEELREEVTTQHTGNYGLQDQQGLLKWVGDNDGAFGGSPGQMALVAYDNITHVCDRVILYPCLIHVRS